MTDVGSELVEDVLLRKKAEFIVRAAPLEMAPWVYFYLEGKLLDKGSKKHGEFLLFDGKAGDFDLTFTLDDQSGLHLEFYEDFEDAMWVSEGPACPPAGRGNGGGAIRGVSVEKLELKATNTNLTRQFLTFMLRFDGDTDGEKTPPYEYDPKIINGGG